MGEDLDKPAFPFSSNLSRLDVQGVIHYIRTSFLIIAPKQASLTSDSILSFRWLVHTQSLCTHHTCAPGDQSRTATVLKDTQCYSWLTVVSDVDVLGVF
jgi:hypothetical protein